MATTTKARSKFKPAVRPPPAAPPRMAPPNAGPDTANPPVSAKRSSPDGPQAAPAKRFKPSVPAPVPVPAPADAPPLHRTPKGKAPLAARHWSPEHGETSSEFSSNLRPPFRPPLPPPPSTPRPSPHTPHPDYFSLDRISLDDLKALLADNLHFCSIVSKMVIDYAQDTKDHDIMNLSYTLFHTKERIRDIRHRIASLNAVHGTDLPFRSLPTSSSLFPEPSTSSRRLHFAPTPPPSMPISDFSNTTLDTSTILLAAPTVQNHTPDTIDSPNTVEIDLDLRKISSATLVVGDSEDAYYDNFDPIPDFFDTDTPQRHPCSAIASTSMSISSSIPVPALSMISGGRIDHTSSPYYKEVISILKNTFKLSTFRTNQLECIIATLDGKDVFYLAPTGGGKSLCFQLPALCVTGKTQGTTFVISPLISLITDQVTALRKKGVRVFPLTSAVEEYEVRQAMRMMRSNIEEKPKLVYTTPERFQKSDCLKDVVDQLYEEKQLARFVIDEAHVIGSWGRDFRASYAALNILRKNWPNVPIMALTGSAGKDAIEDIKHNLELRNPVCLAQSFNRPNLHYSVRKKPTLKKDLVQNVAGFIKTHHPDNTGIIYVLSRTDSEEMAQKLREEFGIEARHYHAGINNEERKINQDDWMAGVCKVIVATIAFGMGIDKPDVRFVIHATLSKDMDGYYQETGRAGRDGRSSDCVLFYTYSDAVKIEKMLRNPNTNDPTRDKPCDAEIERQVAKLQGIVAYCCNESDCRRVLLLRHFDENFNSDDCHNQCDNCHRPGTLIQHDFTVEARQLIQLLQEMMTVNGRGVTQGQLKDTWKGKNNKTVQQYKGVSLYTSGKALSQPTVERIFTHLVAEGFISMYRVVSSSGYSNTYIQPGSAAADFLDGGKQLVLSWKEDVKASAKKTPAKPVSRKKGKEPDRQHNSHYVNLYDDIEDDIDDQSEAEVLKDVIDNGDASEPTISRAPRTATLRSANSTVVQSKAAAVSEDDPATRLERLRETRSSISKAFNKPCPEDILQDDTLQLLALTNPKDEEEFKNILMDCEEPDGVQNKWNSYGFYFLAALQDLSSAHDACGAAKQCPDFPFNR